MTTLHTGGALGADTAFATLALNKGMSVIIHSFKNHKVAQPTIREDNPLRPRIIIHKPSELNIAYQDYIVPVIGKLGRRPMKDKYKRNLLARDYFQVNAVEAVFAVGELDVTQYPEIVVKGGTGYAVKIATNLLGVPKVAIYDQRRKQWFNLSGIPTENNNWKYKVHTSDTCDFRPSDFGSIAGIGTRNLEGWGSLAILNLMAK